MRYKNSYLGILWVILKPMAMFAISYFVWSNIFKGDPNFKFNLLLGLIIMMFYSEIMLMGLSSLKNRAYIILKINFRRDVAIFSATSIAVIDLLINMVIFLIFSINSTAHTSPLGILLFVTSMITLYLLCLGASFFLSIWFIRLRDLQNIVELINSLLYWATPIFYPISIIPTKFQPFILNNPLTIVVTAARNGLIKGDKIGFESFQSILILLAIAIVIFVLGLIYFKKKVPKIAEYF
ncbi:ABC transporter permease [Candidatus Dojkabacteria bacterium]|jgi:ABC-2 type transport system permease protein|nr:ABC transporter permease [Candidatus Dojkabacteria bacterium]